MTDLTSAIQFFQTGFTILLSLAIGEGFKQLVPDGDKDINLDRIPSLAALLFMIFPFFHGMSRYFYTTYLTHPETRLGPVAGHIVFDGGIFMSLAATFFVMSRSLSSSHWVRFYGALVALLVIDTIWILVSMIRYDAPLLPWLFLNLGLGVVLAVVLAIYHRPSKPYSTDNPAPTCPSWIAAIATLASSTLGYVLMQAFYFPD
jgi:hypothetical protein